MTEKEKKIKCIEDICNPDLPYGEKLDAYEFLCDEGEEVLDEMIARLYNTEGDDAQMLIEILANFKGRKEIYLWLVTFFYRGDDVALFAKLLGSYGDERAIDVLNSFAKENELNYNEFMEVRNAVEMLGGIFVSKQDFSDDPFYKFIKGIDESETTKEDEQTDSDGNEDDCGCSTNVSVNSCNYMHDGFDNEDEDGDCDCEDDDCEDDDCDCHHEGNSDCDCGDDCDCHHEGNDCGCHHDK